MLLLIIKFGFSFGVLFVIAVFIIIIGLLLINYLSRTNKIFLYIRNISYTFGIIWLISFILLELLIFIYPMTLKQDNPDFVIVLGAKIHNDMPSVSLKKRLDKAISILDDNKDIIIIVSGGVGTGEDYSEAYVMKKYLLKMGVENEIIREDRSHSTIENIKFSKEIIDSYDIENPRIAISTSHYHIFRATYISRKLGLDTYGISSSVPLLTYLSDGVREYFAIIKLIVLGIWSY